MLYIPLNPPSKGTFINPPFEGGQGDVLVLPQ